MTSQMRRSGASIPYNIAEGCGRGTDGDFKRSLHFSLGSACELEYQLLLARDLGILSSDAYSSLNDSLSEVRRMLIALTQRIEHGNV